jgi:predicted HicB family RNase H-like nuclease
LKKPTLTDAVASKAVPAAAPSPEPAAPPRRQDERIATTLRIDPAKLEELKILAARRRVRVNDLILQGIEHVLALHQQT